LKAVAASENDSVYFLGRMGCRQSSVAWIHRYPAVQSAGAGCMFLNRTHVLVGFHSPRTTCGQVKISGIGGKRENTELWYETAIRETVEELFHVREVPATLISELLDIEPMTVSFQKEPEYACIVYSLKQLPRFLQICQKWIQSPIYAQFPITLEHLLETRQMQRDAEIMQFVLWPRDVTHKRYRLSCDLLQDLQSMEHFNG
jgi:hypothetical protein